MITSETNLVRLALALGAENFGGPLSLAERNLISGLQSGPAVSSTERDWAVASIGAGGDPLGDAFLKLRDAATRRTDGAVFTPPPLLRPMVDWIVAQSPARVVDAGTGSGRFVAEVLRRLPEVKVVAIDLDPVATLMTRAMAAVLGGQNVEIVQADYTSFKLSVIDGRTAYVGNPPYVRHHQLSQSAKSWAQTSATALGHKFSGLAGLHAYFFLATAMGGKPGDVGCFVTSSEWLDVNYGAIMRNLVLGQLGGESLHVVEPRALPFEGTQTTAVITTFRLHSEPDSLRMQDVEQSDDLKDLATAGKPIARSRLVEAHRWSGLLRSAQAVPDGFIELGELCRVHRGTVTGANATWVLRQASSLPDRVLFPSVTKARELFSAGAVLADRSTLRLVVDIPPDLDALDASERKSVEAFLRVAKKAGIDRGYVAAHRRAWWSVGLKTPAPILATYMARRPPAFVMNAAEARHINIAHGLYPRQDFGSHVMSRLAESLRSGTVLSQGRAYAGGLTKFEPKEMERLMVPNLDTLRDHEPLSSAVNA